MCRGRYIELVVEKTGKAVAAGDVGTAPSASIVEGPAYPMLMAIAILYAFGLPVG